MDNRKRTDVPRVRRRALAFALLAVMGAAPSAYAQSTAATLRGQVVLDSAAAGGARVTATNVGTGLTRSTEATAGGSYSLAGLPPGTYRIEVQAGGRSDTRDVTLAVGQTATLDLGVGGTAGTAGDAVDLDTVRVTAPLLAETRTSEVATYVSQKQIEALPQSSRNFLAFADTVPGITFTRSGADEVASIRSGAQVSNAVNVFIDGVGQKDYVLKGGLSGQDSTAGNPFPQLAVGEYKVITSNYKAEYDQLSSAAITAATRSGTNTFTGQFFWDSTSDDWTARTPTELRDNNQSARRAEQYGASLGGPIVRDLLHFFVSYEAKDIVRPRAVTPGRDYAIGDLPPEYQLSALLTGGSPFKQDLFFGKLSFAPGDAHLFEFSAKLREEDDIVNVGGVNTIGSATTRAGKDNRLDLRYQYSGENFLNDAHITYEDVSFGPRPLFSGIGQSLRIPVRGQEAVNNPNMDTILNIGAGPDLQDKGQKGTAFQNDFTWFGIEGHTIKAGFKYKKIDISAYQRNPANPQFRYDINQSIVVPYEVQFTATGIGQSGPISSDTTQLGLYVQDDWEVNEHLTLNLGLRWDYEQTPSFEDHVTPTALVDALRAYAPINSPGVDYDYNDYISTGSNRSAFKGAWQPRIGFSYDFAGDQRHVIFGGAGRAYNRNQFDYLARERYSLAFQSYTYAFDTPGHRCLGVSIACLPFDPAYYDQAALDALVAANPNRGAQVNMIHNELKVPYSDQFSLGMRNAFELMGHDWNSSVTLKHVLSHDGIIFSYGNRRAGGEYFQPGFSFGNAPPADLPGFGRLIIARNGVETRLNSLEVSLDKPFTQASRWGTTFAYTYSNAKENRANHDTYSFDYPSLDFAAFAPSIGVPRHRVVATGIADLGWGFTLSSKLTLETPSAINSTNCVDAIDTRNCFFDPFFPNTSIGYKQLDVALQKRFDTGTSIAPWIRMDVLNVFNWRNWTGYFTNRGTGRTPGDPNSQPAPDANFGNRNPANLAIAYPTRMLKLSMGFDW